MNKLIMRTLHILGWILLLSLLLSPIFAEDFYADVKLEIDTSEVIEISGTANHPKLVAGKTQDYISINGDYYILNITLEDNFSEYNYDISFPINTIITPIEISGDFRMETFDRRLHLVGTGENEPLIISVQYNFGDEHEPFIRGKNSSANNSQRGMLNELLIVQIILILLLIAALILGGFYLFRYNRKKQEKIEKPKYNPEALTDRQKLIVDYLEKKKKPVTQAELQREIGLPKASLSRNIDSLIKKGIVSKERKGMTNIIFINKN
ncbi:MAG: winged helix-turn-helix transcriptional regulator [Candidatus Aenigmarchaeota archaeon]|nr:winged helix-turn-helix transcriptional regulator [Candidatus Aenigmarchaeota archaeon]